MNEDEHADDCQVVQARAAQIVLYGAIRDAWPGGALCTCRHWRRYNNAVPPAWYVAEIVGW